MLKHAETIAACMEGMLHAVFLGMERIIVETDAVNVLNALNGMGSDRSVLGTMFREIRAKFWRVTQ